MEFRDGDAVAPLAVVGDAGGKRGTEVTFLPSTETFTMIEFDFATLEHRLRELAFLNSGVTIVLSDMRHAVEKREEMRYEGGVEAFVQISRPQQDAADPDADHDQGRARRRRASNARCGGTTATTRPCSASPTTSRSATAARIWPASAAR